MNHRNCELDIIKFISCCSIVLLHYSTLFLGKQYAQGGYIATDLFFMISGYLLMQGVERVAVDENTGMLTIKFIGKKLKYLWPYVVIAFLMYYLPYIY